MKAIILLFVSALICGSLASSLGNVSPFIIDGRPVGDKEIPYAVGIMVHRPMNPGWCSGVLISRNYVLTVAKCAVNVPTASVLIGATDVQKPESTIYVENIVPHPLFDAGSEKHDIAILKLSRPANLSETVGLARLPSRAQAKETFTGQIATSFGWGKGSKATTPNEKLHAVNGTIITNISCLKSYPAYITDSNVCTDSNTGTPCTGDEGSGLFITDEDGYPTQIGLFSYQFSLGCNMGWPPVFTRLTKYLDWIQDNSDVIIRDN